MKGKKKIFALLAAGLVCLSAPVQARHAAVSGAVTIVHPDRELQKQQVKTLK